MLSESLRVLLVACLASVGWMTATLLMGAYVIYPLLSRYHAGELPEVQPGERPPADGLARIIPFPAERSRRMKAEARPSENPRRGASVVRLRQLSQL